ncbi:MAG: sulfur oxidation c-type cytochrome SoxX [Pseudomonadota bacterium]
MKSKRCYYEKIAIAVVRASGPCVLLMYLLSCCLTAWATESGREIAFDRSRGNCLACHAIGGGEQLGNVGPDLRQIERRYSKQALREKIFDAAKGNPRSVMPRYGYHKILTPVEIDALVEFLMKHQGQ